MGTWRRTAVRWVLRGLTALLVVIALDVAILAFPQPLFDHRKTWGEYTVYSDDPLPEQFGEVVADARRRVAAMDGFVPGERYRVFVCGSQRKYGLFAFLTRKGSDSLAIGLSMFNHLYLNETRIRLFADRNSAGILHSRFEGNFGEVIAHEIAHFHMVDALGYRSAMNMPVWKSEGYAEYQANRAATAADPEYDFAARVDLYLDDAIWVSSASARKLFEWHLLVEFLAEERGMDLPVLVSPEVTEAGARAEMLAWRRNLQP